MKELNSTSNYSVRKHPGVWKISLKQNAVAFGKNSGIIQLRQKKKVKRATLGRSFFAQCFISQLQAVEELKLASTAGRQRYTEVSTER